MASDVSNVITEELIDAVRRIAATRAHALGLKGADLEDFIGDAFLAMCLLAAEWNPERGVPIEPWVVGRLRVRMYDIARQRMPGLRSGNRFVEVPRSPHDYGGDWSPGLDPPDPASLDEATPDDSFVWAVAADDRERFILSALAEGILKKQEIAGKVGVSPSRVSQIIADIRARAAGGLRRSP